MNFKPRGTRSKVGVRPIIEVRPILGNLRYVESSTYDNMVMKWF